MAAAPQANTINSAASTSDYASTYWSLATGTLIMIGGFALSASTGGIALPLIGSVVAGAGISGTSHTLSNWGNEAESIWTQSYWWETTKGALVSFATSGTSALATEGVKFIGAKMAESTIKSAITLTNTINNFDELSVLAMKKAGEKLANHGMVKVGISAISQATGDITKTLIKTTTDEPEETPPETNVLATLGNTAIKGAALGGLGTAITMGTESILMPTNIHDKWTTIQAIAATGTSQAISNASTRLAVNLVSESKAIFFEVDMEKDAYFTQVTKIVQNLKRRANHILEGVLEEAVIGGSISLLAAGVYAALEPMQVENLKEKQAEELYKIAKMLEDGVISVADLEKLIATSPLLDSQNNENTKENTRTTPFNDTLSKPIKGSDVKHEL